MNAPEVLVAARKVLDDNINLELTLAVDGRRCKVVVPMPDHDCYSFYGDPPEPTWLNFVTYDYYV